MTSWEGFEPFKETKYLDFDQNTSVGSDLLI